MTQKTRTLARRYVYRVVNEIYLSCLSFNFLPMQAFSSVVIDVKIERVHIYELPAPTGSAFVTINGNGRSDDPCSGSDKQYLLILMINLEELCFTRMR